MAEAKQSIKAKKKSPNPLSSFEMMRLRPREIKWSAYGDTASRSTTGAGGQCPSLLGQHSRHHPYSSNTNGDGIHEDLPQNFKGHFKHMNMNSSGKGTCAEKTHKLWAGMSAQVFAVTVPATPLPVQAALCAGAAPLRWAVSGRGGSAPGSSESLGSRTDAWTKQIPRADKQITKPKLTGATSNALVSFMYTLCC